MIVVNFLVLYLAGFAVPCNYRERLLQVFCQRIEVHCQCYSDCKFNWEYIEMSLCSFMSCVLVVVRIFRGVRSQSMS